jgi:hypothetical protein
MNQTDAQTKPEEKPDPKAQWIVDNLYREESAMRAMAEVLRKIGGGK